MLIAIRILTRAAKSSNYSEVNSIGGKCRCISTSNNFLSKTAIQPQPTHLRLNGQSYTIDNWTNVTPKILSYVGLNKHLQKDHPLSIIKQRIVNYLYQGYKKSSGNTSFSVYDKLNPIVAVHQNFDKLLIPVGHVSSKQSDCYYINSQQLLRSCITAHQIDLISSGLQNYIAVGEVYRRDEIRSTHYSVLHQLDAVRLTTKDELFKRNLELEIFESSWCDKSGNTFQPIYPYLKCIDQSKQPCHTLEAVKLMEYELKQESLGLAQDLFGSQIKCRWADTHTSFTQPSWKLEIFYKDNWVDVLGCGIIRHEILLQSGSKNSIGYTVSLNLERLAMLLFDIPDVRLFWSKNTGFLTQFNEADLGKFNKYVPCAQFPQYKKALSFWLPEGVDVGNGFELNDFYDLVITLARDKVEQATLVEKYRHPEKGLNSVCFGIIYRHMERTLKPSKVKEIHKSIADSCVEQFEDAAHRILHTLTFSNDINVPTEQIATMSTLLTDINS